MEYHALGKYALDAYKEGVDNYLLIDEVQMHIDRENGKVVIYSHYR